MRALLFVALAFVGACASTPRVTDALADWRTGKKPAALVKARGELERFRVGNHLASGDIEARLDEVNLFFESATPILLPEPSPHEHGPVDAPSPVDQIGPTDQIGPIDPMDRGPSPDRGLREDLASSGVTRALRAIRVIDRLGLVRFAPDLLIAIWRRPPWEAEGPLLADASTAMRSLVVKLAALHALERM